MIIITSAIFSIYIDISLFSLIDLKTKNLIGFQNKYSVISIMVSNMSFFLFFFFFYTLICSIKFRRTSENGPE